MRGQNYVTFNGNIYLFICHVQRTIVKYFGSSSLTLDFSSESNSYC